MSSLISSEGIVIPDSVIDSVFTLMPMQQFQSAEMLSGASPTILSQLQQSGLVQKMQTSTQTFAKNTVRQQITRMLTPYKSILPLVFAFTLFLTLEFGLSLLTYLFYPVVSILFYLFEKTAIISFTIEKRDVKKLVTT